VYKFKSVDIGFVQHCNAKCAGNNPATLARRQDTCTELYGASNVFASDFGKQRIKESCMVKYGVENYQSTPESIDNRYQRTSKIYTFASGNAYTVQGYEPRAIDILAKLGYAESDLLLRNRPTIKYHWSSQDGIGDDKWHVYHPDIVIPFNNKIIEVKSDWTFSGKPELLSKNMAKLAGCIIAGYTCEFWIFNKS
jgi:hypothetical protein